MDFTLARRLAPVAAVFVSEGLAFFFEICYNQCKIGGDYVVSEQYTLMHKNIPVMDCLFENDEFVKGVRGINLEHAPVGVHNSLGRIENKRLRAWWSRRHVGPGRINWPYVKHAIRCDSPGVLVKLSSGCSLSDQYWIRPIDSNVLYEKVSFFLNDFDSDLFDLFLFAGDIRYDAELSSPSCMTWGSTPKAWQVEDGKRVLYKAPGHMFDQEPYNEYIASCLGKALGARVVSNALSTVHGMTCVRCDCMLSDSEELIYAGDIVSDNGRIGKDLSSDISFFINFAKRHGVRDVEKSISDMVLIDFLMRNGDRNWYNFGLVRDADTLKYKRMALLFDFDSSLFYDTTDITNRHFCKSAFSGDSLYEDLKYCTCSDMRKVNLFPDIVRKVLSFSNLDGDRRKKLQAFAVDRLEMLTDSQCYRMFKHRMRGDLL